MSLKVHVYRQGSESNPAGLMDAGVLHAIALATPVTAQLATASQALEALGSLLTCLGSVTTTTSDPEYKYIWIEEEQRYERVCCNVGLLQVDDEEPQPIELFVQEDTPYPPPT